MKAGYGKTVRPVCAADGGQLFNGRLLRPDSCEVAEQSRVTGGGGGGAKGRDQGERGSAKHATDSDPGARDPGAEPRTASRKAKEEGQVHRARLHIMRSTKNRLGSYARYLNCTALRASALAPLLV
jgi:hypothetical protein